MRQAMLHQVRAAMAYAALAYAALAYAALTCAALTCAALAAQPTPAQEGEKSPPRPAPAAQKPVPSAPKATLVPATITVKLPAGAKLEVQGQELPGRGPELRFHSPPLAAGKRYSYLLKVTWDEGGQTRVAERKIPVQAGEVVTVKLPEDPPPVVLSADEQGVLDLTNRERTRAGLKALAANAQLMEAARGHAANMARKKSMEHTLDGKEFWQRIEAAGYVGAESGENIAAAAPSPKIVVELWMNSPGHKANILGAGFQETGIGVVAGKDGTKYWTQVFGSPR